MINYESIGRNLAALRKQTNRTQVQLAKLFNVSHQAISKWERGESLPSLETLLSLSHLYGLTVDQLLNPSTHQELVNHSQTNHACDLLNIQGMCAEVHKRFKSKLSKPSYQTWIEPTTIQTTGNVYIIQTPTALAKEWIESRYGDMFLSVIQEITGSSTVQLQFKHIDN